MDTFDVVARHVATPGGGSAYSGAIAPAARAIGAA